MTKHVVRVGGPSGAPWLDVVSHGRHGPGQAPAFTRSQLEMIARTVRRTPEVMVKVSGGGRSTKAVAAHMNYIGRHGKLDIETDLGERIQGAMAAKLILDDWALDLEIARHGTQGNIARASGPSKLVHNIILSMPARTEPDKLLAAAKAFAQEEFALKHRYAMVLHTDQDHPHVHLVVKAIGVKGQRLNIRKATLRQWRQQFATQLRAVGVPANATPGRLRAQAKARVPDGLYRLLRRQDRHAQTYLRRRTAASESVRTRRLPTIDASDATARKGALATWQSVRDQLAHSGELGLAREVQGFMLGIAGPQVQRWREDELVR